MGRICEHAEILNAPCKGSVFSREIKCGAGHENTCLKKCSSDCPSYKPAAPAPPPNRQPAVKPPPREQIPRQTARQPPKRSGGCGACGGRRTAVK